MAILTRDSEFGWNLKLRNLPLLWFAERASAVAMIGAVWPYIENP